MMSPGPEFELERNGKPWNQGKKESFRAESRMVRIARWVGLAEGSTQVWRDYAKATDPSKPSFQVSGAE